MRRTIWSVQDAKNRFSEVVEAARRKPQTVTKHGKPAVVIVDAGEYDRLRKLQPSRRRSTKCCRRGEGEGEFERLDTTPRDVEF